MKSSRTKRLSVFLTLLLAFSCTESEKNIKEQEAPEVAKLPYFNSADFTPDWDSKKHQIPAYSFLNQNGKLISNKTYEGKIYVADFFFTICPGICSKLTSNMEKLQEEFKNDSEIMFLSHSVMPWHDSVAVLKKYALEKGVDDTKWNLVTGDKDSIYAIARNGYFADENFTKTQDASSFIHTENFILVDKEGYIRGVYNGTLEVDMERLKRHIEILEKES